MSTFGRGLNREVVAAVNRGFISEPFSVKDVRLLIREKGWKPEPSEKYVIARLAIGANDNHGHTHKKYFHSLGDGLYKLRAEYQGAEWL